MRNAFADEITALAGRHDDVVLLSGDIGNRLFDRYKDGHPQRFMNCGVAEANMIGVAAGLALSGLRPVAYTITPFITTRCLEQIRVDLCYHRLPALIVGTGSGLSYGSLGPTHHSLEDIALLRALPNMTVLCPADANELRALLRSALRHDGPVYMRIGKKGEPLVHAEVPDLAIGGAIELRGGEDLCLLATGNVLPLAIAVADRLSDRGFSARVISHPTVKPLDGALLARVFAEHALVATLEEHSLIGGFGSAVAEWAVDHGTGGARLLRFGTEDRFPDRIGGQTYLRNELGLGLDLVTERIAGAMEERRTRTAACG